MRILLISFFNSTNLGDLLLSENLVKLLKQTNDIENYAFPGFYKHTKPILEIKNATKKDKPQRLFKKKLIPWYRYFKIKFLNKYADIEKAVSQCDEIYIGGGNMLMDLDNAPNYVLQFKRLVDIAYKHNKKVNVVCVGAGPFKTKYQERILKKALKKCENISVRDMFSKKLIERFNLKKEIEVCPDIAFMEEATDAQNKEYIAINICLGQKHINSYATLIDKIHKAFPEYKIALYSTEAMDYLEIEELYNPEYMQIVEIKNKNDLFKLYAQTKIVVATRMHSIILAYTQNVPAIGIAWSDKVYGLFELMKKPQDVYSQDKISESTDDIVDNIKKKLLAYERERESIKNTLNEHRNEIKKHFAKLLWKGDK